MLLPQRIAAQCAQRRDATAVLHVGGADPVALSYGQVDALCLSLSRARSLSLSRTRTLTLSKNECLLPLQKWRASKLPVPARAGTWPVL